MVATKRKHHLDSPNEVYGNKSRAKPAVEARVDPTYGQRSALPGLDNDANFDGFDEDLNYDDQDALRYLRAVRFVPFLFHFLFPFPFPSSQQKIRAEIAIWSAEKF
jgi:hypothetical protein